MHNNKAPGVDEIVSGIGPCRHVGTGTRCPIDLCVADPSGPYSIAKCSGTLDGRYSGTIFAFIAVQKYFLRHVLSFET